MIDSKQRFAEYMAADLAAHGLDRWRLRYRWTQRALHFQRLLRRAEYWGNVRRDPFGRLMFAWFLVRVKLLGERLVLVIPRNVCGPGLRIAHPHCVGIHHLAKIGARCTIHHVVTVGVAGGRYPVIGDDVFIEPHSIILGANVGDQAYVHAGAVVTKDVPPGVRVAGVPARPTKARHGDGSVTVPVEPAEPLSHS